MRWAVRWLEGWMTRRDQWLFKGGYWIASIVIGLLLIFSAAHKLLDLESFALTVFRYQLLPDPLVNLTAILLPWIELVCGISLLLIWRWRFAALWLVLIIFSAFTIGIIINLFRGTPFGCGCFKDSALEDPMSWFSVLRNALLLLLIGLGIFWHIRSGQSE
jgi:uncharacterized membrane protein YphA (DoxX/SURF4 family)